MARSPSFDRAFHDLMDLEGWDTPHRVRGDSGGLTVYGIAKNYNPEMYEDGLPTREEAMQFYRENYWLPMNLGGLLSHRMAFEVLEFSVNSGDGRGYETSVRVAQLASNRVLTLADRKNECIHIDGVMGSNTRDAMNDCVPYKSAWVTFFNHHQLDYYEQLPKDQKQRFLLGWTRRV